LCRSFDSAAMLTGQHNQYSSTINLVAQSTLWQDPYPGSQQAGTINTSAPSSVWPSQHSGTVNTLAQSTLQHSQHSGTITSPAQSSFQHSPTSEHARPGQHTVNPSLCTVSTSLPPQLLQILLQVCAYGPLIGDSFSSRLMQLV